MLIRYIIYGLLGWNIEVIWTGLGSLVGGNRSMMGHTSIWMFFIYGLAVFLLEPIHNLISEYHWYVRGCVWATLILLIEFVTGLVLRAFGVEAWYYTGPLAVLGLIRLDYAPLWFGVGLIFEQIHNLLINYHVGVK